MIKNNFKLIIKVCLNIKLKNINFFVNLKHLVLKIIYKKFNQF